MAKHFHKELEKIKKRILSLGSLVEERVRMATKAIKEKNAAIAEEVIRLDYEIDESEVEVEEECLKILALYQPVAIDLRFLVVVIKINKDLERIGDQAVNIAERVESIVKHQGVAFYFDYSQMAQKAVNMLKMSLDALVNLDVDAAFKVAMMDDEVDGIQKEAYDQIKQAIRKDPAHVTYLINLYLISRHLERIADHATNIAEEVIYLVEGEIVRHRKF